MKLLLDTCAWGGTTQALILSHARDKAINIGDSLVDLVEQIEKTVLCRAGSERLHARHP
jgi:hypothetical protein